MTPPQVPSERCFTWTRRPRTSTALKRAPFPEATTMPPVGSKSAVAALEVGLDPALPSAQATASIASEMNVVRNMSVFPLLRPPRAEAEHRRAPVPATRTGDVLQGTPPSVSPRRVDGAAVRLAAGGMDPAAGASGTSESRV